MKTAALTLSPATGTATTPKQFNPGLMADFVKWIDRTEKTTRSYLTNLKQFAAWIKFAAITNPVRDDIISYRQWLAAEHDAITLDPESAAGWKYRTDAAGNPKKIICKPGTVAQYLRSVKQFFKWTAANGLYDDIAANIHAPKVSNDKHKKDALTANQVLTIEKSITANAADKKKMAADSIKDTAGRIQRADEQGKRLNAMYLLAVTAGLRTIEIHRANVKDLETKDGQTWLYIWGKGRTEADERKPIAHEVAEAIKDYLNSRSDHYTGSSPLFVSTGNRSHGKRIATTTISTMLKQAMQAAGFNSERLTAHSLRHSAAQAALKATDKNIYEVQKYLRHANPKTTETYLHEDEESQKAEIETANKIYDSFHPGAQSDSRQKLEQALSSLTPQQMDKLAAMAATL